MAQLKRSKHIKLIPLAEIKRAANGFAVCIGKGGYGMVYKGELIISPDSRRSIPVAMKRLDPQYGQGLKEFLTEIELLSGQKHPNLINLVGYCDEEKEKILVYEYAENGSLDKYLSRSNRTRTLTWSERLNICVGAARGLEFLHNHVGKHQTIIHRDIKSANILIDENWVAKVSDLGLSKLSLTGLDRSEVISHACGTRGYCEPEYVNTGIVTKESDVYSFGMVLFEVLYGRLCSTQDENGFLFALVKKYYKEKRLDEIVDPSLKGEVNLKSLKSFAAIAYGCLHDDRKQRPSISHVLKELESLKTLHISQNESHEVGSSSRSYSKLEIRDKVKRVFQRFDRNKDGGLNKEELEALILATNSHLKYSSQEQINRELDKVFHLYDKFIDGEKGLTYDGLLRIYDEDGDIDRDFEVLGLKVEPHNDKNPTFIVPYWNLAGVHGWKIVEKCRNIWMDVQEWQIVFQVTRLIVFLVVLWLLVMQILQKTIVIKKEIQFN